MKTRLTIAAAITAVALSPAASAHTHQKVIWVDGQTVWIAVGYPPGSNGYRFITDTLGGNGHPVVSAEESHFTTDTLAPGGKTIPVQSYRFITDTLAPGGSTSVIAASSPGFSWTDAGIGAGAASGALFLLAAAAMFALRRRHVLAF
jgi:hypothetical protein